jgi:hypothetical protein
VDQSKREGRGPICIGVNRRLSAALTLLSGLVVVVGIEHAASAHNWVGVLIASLVPGPFFASRTLRRSPLIVVDDEAFTDGRSGMVIPWHSIADVHVRQRQGLFATYHRLVLNVGTTARPIMVPLEQLSVPWRDVVALVQGHLGRSVPTRQ